MKFRPTGSFAKAALVNRRQEKFKKTPDAQQVAQLVAEDVREILRAKAAEKSKEE